MIFILHTERTLLIQVMNHHTNVEIVTVIKENVCRVIKENYKHKFITWPLAKAIWVVTSQAWASLTSSVLSLLKGFLIEGVRGLPTPSY